VLGAACAACRYRDVASHSSFESAGRELNSPSLTQRAKNTWLFLARSVTEGNKGVVRSKGIWVDGRSQRQACNNFCGHE
jgi:hypothetical protein